MGSFTDYASLLTWLDIGAMKLKNKIGWNSIVLMGGAAEVVKNKMTILFTSAEDGSSIYSKTT